MLRRADIALITRCLAAVVTVCLAAAGMVAAAYAQARPDEPAGGFVSQFPEGDVYRVVVIGDAFAEGLPPALADVLASEQRLQVIRKHRSIGALVRPEWEDDVKAEEASKETAHIVVVMTGLYDKQAFRVPGNARPLAIGSDDWKDEYARRFDRLLKAVKKRNTAVYVIGQPILRNQTQNMHGELLSDVMRQRAGAAGAKFIDIYETFQDDSGGFSQFGPDMSGNRVKLREGGDGVMLTSQGQKKLALVIERDLKRDVAQAASDRAIPLAGDEAEQRRLVPAKAAGAATTAGWKGAAVGAKSGVASQVPVAPTADSSGDQKADNGRITLRTLNAAGREEQAVIEIIRPAIPAAVVALMTRRESAGERITQIGESVVEDIGNGLTVVNSVASLSDIAGAGQGQSQQAQGAKRKMPATQSAFYQVLIKGERPTPKPGRADDFRWPRVETLPEPEARPAATPAAVRTAPQPAPGARPANAPSPQPRTQPQPR